jgi:hypothetical protein
MKLETCIIVILASVAPVSGQPESAPRERVSINRDWKSRP